MLQDIFDPLITLGQPDSVATLLSSDAVNRTVPPEGGELLFSFLGTKGTGGWSGANRAGSGAGRLHWGPDEHAQSADAVGGWRRAAGLPAARLFSLPLPYCSSPLPPLLPRRLPYPRFPHLSNPAGKTNDTNPYNVGAIEDVTFNNLHCTMVEAGPGAPKPQAALPVAAAKPTDVQVCLGGVYEGDGVGGWGARPTLSLTPPHMSAHNPPHPHPSPLQLQVEYTPIEYLGQPIVSTFTQFLIRRAWWWGEGWVAWGWVG